MGSDSCPEPEQASLLSGPARSGLCDMETWRKRQKANIFLVSEMFSFLMYADGDHPQNARLRDLHGEKSRWRLHVRVTSTQH